MGYETTFSDMIAERTKPNKPKIKLLYRTFKVESNKGYGYYFKLSLDGISVMISGRMFSIQGFRFGRLHWFTWDNYFRTNRLKIKDVFKK